MSSKSLSKCFEGKMYLQTHNNSRVIWPKSLINIQKFVNNNNTEEASDIYLVMPSEYEEEGNTEGATPLILSTEGVLQINGNEKNCYIQAEDNKSIVNNQEVSNDEELTSLTWLQNVDLLQSMKFLSNAPGILREPVIGSGETLNNRMKLESQSISYHDSGNESSWDESNQSNPETLPNGTCWNNRPIPAQSRANAKSLSRLTKPPHSFSTMIFLAIESSSTKALPVRDIYSWIIKHFPYYRYAPLGWKNSVRHNLSLNRCFCKHENGPSAGKGSLWTVDPAHRPQLIQSLGKAPYLKADLIQQIVRDRPTNDFKNMDSTLLVSISESPAITSTNRSNIPDPKLFPYLSRHLAIKSNSIDNSDVDAATAMLALGQSHEHTLNSDATQNQQWALLPKKDYSLRKNRVTLGPMISVEGTEEESKAREDIIAASNSPLTIDDHTYSFSPRQGRPRSQSSNVHLLGKKLFFSTTSNVDNPPEAVSELEVSTYEGISSKYCRTEKIKNKRKGNGAHRMSCKSKLR